MRESKAIQIGTWLRRKNSGQSTKGSESLLVVVADNKERGEYQVGRVDSYSFDGEGRCLPVFGRETWVRYKTIQDARYAVVAEPTPPTAIAPGQALVIDPASVAGDLRWEELGASGKLEVLRDLLAATISAQHALVAKVDALTAAVSALHPSVQTALPFRPSPVAAVRKAS